MKTAAKHIFPLAGVVVASHFEKRNPPRIDGKKPRKGAKSRALKWFEKMRLKKSCESTPRKKTK